MNKGQRPKIGLALGSGGARGYAHIGVIKALEAAGIPIDFIAGSSIGAMVGGFYASGRSIQYIENLALGADWRKVFATLLEPSFRRGFLAGEKAKAFIQEHTDKKTFEECRIPFVAVVTDMKTGEPVILDQGDLATAIRASTSIPLVFRPFMVDGRMLADGGLSVPVPAEIVRSMGADIVIAVNLDGFLGDEAGNLGWYDIANDSLNILRHHLARANVAKADLVINISLRDVAWYDFVNGEDKIVLGEQSMRQLIPKLKRLIVQKAKSSKSSLWNAFFE